MGTHRRRPRRSGARAVVPHRQVQTPGSQSMASLQQSVESQQSGPQLGVPPCGRQHRCPWQVWPEPEGQGQVSVQAGRAGHAGAQAPGRGPCPVPTPQLPEQHWLFFLHALPLPLQAWALTARPLSARTPLATIPARPRRAWRRDRVWPKRRTRPSNRAESIVLPFLRCAGGPCPRQAELPARMCHCLRWSHHTPPGAARLSLTVARPPARSEPVTGFSCDNVPYPQTKWDR
jgi:hypothetical protein